MAQFAFEDLEVWQLGMEMVEEIYALTEKMPSEEKFGIVSQVRRASVSIPLNIAEGKGRWHAKEFKQFLYISRGSLYEVITLCKLMTRLNLIDVENNQRILDRADILLGKLNGLINHLKK